MPRFTVWLQHHRLSAFFVLAYAISWSSWPLYAVGLMPGMEFLPIGPLLAAFLVTGLAWGRSGLKAWGRRLIRWRVDWTWYAVALLLPPLMALVAGFANMALGAPASGPGGSDLAGAPDGVRRAAGESDGRPLGRGARLPRLRRARAADGADAAAGRRDPRGPGGRLAPAPGCLRPPQPDRAALDLRHHLPVRVAVQPHRRQRAADAALP